MVPFVLKGLPEHRGGLRIVDLGSGNCRGLRRLVRAFIDNEKAVSCAVGVEEVETLDSLAEHVLSAKNGLMGTGLLRRDFINILGKVEDFDFAGYQIFFAFDFCFGPRVNTIKERKLRHCESLLRTTTTRPGRRERVRLAPALVRSLIALLSS
jgi:hypothetical protein